jgi:hypothetical protein
MEPRALLGKHSATKLYTNPKNTILLLTLHLKNGKEIDDAFLFWNVLIFYNV